MAKTKVTTRRPLPRLSDYPMETHTMEITGDNNEPRYRDGHLFRLLQDDAKSPRAGEDWIFVADEASPNPIYFAGEFIGATRSNWLARQYNNPRGFRLPRVNFRPAFHIIGWIDPN